VVLTDALTVGQIVEIDNYLTAFLPTNALRTITTFTATAGQTTFSVTYTQGLIDVFYNGSNLAQSEYTATNGTSIVLGTACQLNDIVVVYAYSYAVGAFSGIAGSGTTNYVPKFTASSTIGNSLIFDNGTNVGIGTNNPEKELTVWGTNIPTDNAPGNILAYTSNAFGINIGASIGLGGAYQSGGVIAFGSIHGKKENATSGNAAGYLSFVTRNTTGSGERMRITSEGNVGIGVTPKIWYTTDYNIKALQIGSAGALFNLDVTSSNLRLYLSNNSYVESTSAAQTYIVTGAASQFSQENGAFFFRQAPSGSANTPITFTTPITITSGGVLDLAIGQIKFPATQVPSADPNTLDDYEEGTWTPVIGGSGGQSGQNYSGQAGYYTKIGRQVTVTFRVVLSLKGTITGDAVIRGLPFTVDTPISFGSGATYFEALATSWSSIFFNVAASTTYATIDGVKSASTASTRASTSDIANNTQFNGSFTYFV
jgi:hypothetical protein